MEEAHKINELTRVISLVTGKVSKSISQHLSASNDQSFVYNIVSLSETEASDIQAPN